MIRLLSAMAGFGVRFDSGGWSWYRSQIGCLFPPLRRDRTLDDINGLDSPVFDERTRACAAAAGAVRDDPRSKILAANAKRAFIGTNKRDIIRGAPAKQAEESSLTAGGYGRFRPCSLPFNSMPSWALPVLLGNFQNFTAARRTTYGHARAEIHHHRSIDVFARIMREPHRKMMPGSRRADEASQ
jgi:hypothetical protein